MPLFLSGTLLNVLAVLVGTSLMRASDPAASVRALAEAGASCS